MFQPYRIINVITYKIIQKKIINMKPWEIVSNK